MTTENEPGPRGAWPRYLWRIVVTLIAVALARWIIQKMRKGD